MEALYNSILSLQRSPIHVTTGIGKINQNKLFVNVSQKKKKANTKINNKGTI